jgi:hypothetical protein
MNWLRPFPEAEGQPSVFCRCQVLKLQEPPARAFDVFISPHMMGLNNRAFHRSQNDRPRQHLRTHRNRNARCRQR